MEAGTPTGGERDGAIGDCTAIEDEGVMRVGEIKSVRSRSDRTLVCPAWM